MANMSDEYYGMEDASGKMKARFQAFFFRHGFVTSTSRKCGGQWASYGNSFASAERVI
jgi:hypothetical protein